MIIRRQTLGKITISKLCAWLHALGLAALLCCCLGPISSADTSTEWRHLALPAAEAQKHGDIRTAIKLWTKALVLAQKLGTIHPWYSITLRNLIYLHSLVDDNLDLTANLVDQDLDAIKPLGPNYPDKSFDLQYLGRIESIRGRFAESRKCYEEAFAIGENSPITKDSQMELLALVQVPYTALHAEKQAEEARKKLIRLLVRRYPGKLGDAMGETILLSGLIEHDRNMASWADLQYFYDADINLLTEAIEFRVHGTKADLYRCEMLRRRSDCYFQRSNFLAAAADLQSAADVLRNDSTLILVRIDYLYTASEYLRSIACNSEAVQLLEECIRLREQIGCKTTGEAGLLRAYKQSLAYCYFNLHKPEQALAIFNDMLKQRLDTKTRDTILGTIVNFYDTIGDLKSFLEYLNKSCTFAGTMPASGEAIVKWAWLADRYALVGSVAQSDQCMAKALRIAGSLSASKPDDVAKARVSIAELWLDRRRPDQAAKDARQVIAICQTKKLLHDWDPRGRALSVLAQAETMQHHYDEAIKAWQAELDMANADSKNRPFEVVMVPGALAQLYAFQGDRGRANEFADQARERGVRYGIGWSKDLRQLGLLNWALIASKEGRFEQSDQACRTIIQSQTNQEYKFSAHYEMVRHLIEQHKFDAAAKEAEEAMDLHAIRPEPYVHSIASNSTVMWTQLFTGLRARAIDLSGQHAQAQPIFEQLATDDHNMPPSYLPLFANSWCWRAENLRSLALTKHADEAAKLAHKFYEAPGWNLFDTREQCDSASKPH